jgi:hypothetical protein
MLLAALAATAALAAAQDTSRTIEVRDSGEIVRVGAFKPRQYIGDENFSRGVVPNRRNAIRAFGRPDGKNPQGCPNKWKKLGVRMVVADFGGGPACAGTTRIQTLVITGRAWQTERGLRIGDSLDRVRELYPELERFSELYDIDAPIYRHTWGLVFEPSQVGGPPNLLDRLSAEIRGRRVRSLTVSPYGAGD